VEKKTGKRRHFSWFALLLVVVVAYFVSIFVSQQVYLSQVEKDQAAANQRLQAAQEENQRLREEKENLYRLEYIEKVAREELGMTRRGELPYSPGGRK